MTSDNGQYVFYPGCSMQSTAKAYDISMQHVIDVLGLTFNEVDDWNCCGATEYFSLNTIPAYSLVARNLALAAEDGPGELVASCSACYLNLHKTNSYMSKYDELDEQVNQALAAGGLHYTPDSMHVRHLLDVIVEDVGFDAVAENVKQPLTGLRVAPYYGCLLTRPESEWNAEYPTHLDTLMETLGATVVDFPLKTHCCGGHMTQISEDTAFELIRRIVHNADEYEADMIVTICPMCQLNLDVYQPQMNHALGTHYSIPALYFTQMMGLAFGFPPESLGFGSELVDAKPALARIGHEEEKTYRPKRRDKKALPMPSLKP